MSYTRIFNGKKYRHDSLIWDENEAKVKAKTLKKQGFSVRITKGSTRCTNSIFFDIWVYKEVSNEAGDKG